MDARLILAGRSPDFAGSMARGTDLAMRQAEAQRGNALAQLYQTQGPGIAAGDPGALNALAQFDPQAAQGMRIAGEDQQFRREDRAQGMQIERERLEMAREAARMRGEEYARTLSAEQRAAQAEQIERGIAGAVPYVRAGDQAGYAQWLQSQGLDPAQYPMEQFASFAASLVGLAEALKSMEPPAPMSPEGKLQADIAAGHVPAGTTATPGVQVQIDNGGGGKFDEAFASADAKTVDAVYSAGLAASRNIARIDQLGALLDANPTGFAAAAALKAGEFGINTQGLDTLQAAQALINSLVPEQRQPGSGPMSDADLALFKQSLPRIINQPGGNAMIVATMRAIAEYDAEGAAIVQRLRAGEIDRKSAFDLLQNRANPLEGLAPPPAAGPQAGGRGGPQPNADDDPLGLFQ